MLQQGAERDRWQPPRLLGQVDEAVEIEAPPGGEGVETRRLAEDHIGGGAELERLFVRAILELALLDQGTGGARFDLAGGPPGYARPTVATGLCRAPGPREVHGSDEFRRIS